MTSIKVRQIALVTRSVGRVADALREELSLGEPFHDPIVTEFGLQNAVFAWGDSFLEILSPIREGTAGGRHLDRQGGDSGYMVIFQVPDMAEARRRVDSVGVRVIWEATFPDLVGMHLHPKDVPGAIVSLDWTDPPGSWRWGGPAWTARVPPHRPGSIASVTIAVVNPAQAATKWAELLGVEPLAVGACAELRLDDGRQLVRFVTPADGREGLIAVTLSGGEDSADFMVGGVRMIVEPAEVRSS